MINRRKNIFVFLFSFSLFWSCQSENNNEFIQNNSQKENIVNKILSETSKEVERKTALVAIGSGGSIKKGIEILAISFSIKSEISIEEGRNLLIEAARNLIDLVNREKKIRPYLIDYPFDYSRVQIRIFISNENGREPQPGHLSIIRLVEGFLEYDLEDLNSGEFKTLYRESYDNALIKLQKTQQLLDNRKQSSKS